MSLRIDEEITFRKLEILLAFMEAGSLGRTAEKLGLSAVSVHRALHSLEAGVRCTLFRLEGRNLLPTDAALALADVATEVLRTMGEGIRSTREIAGYAADRIRIGSLYSLTSRTVPALIRGLKLRKPDIQTELVLASNAELLVKLRDGAIDAALLGQPEEGATDLESQLLFEDDLFFAAPAGSRFAGLSGVDLRDCRDDRFVSLSEGFVTRTRFDEGFTAAGFRPNVTITTGDIFSLMNLVSGGIGCTLLPGRVRDVLPPGVLMLEMQPRYHALQRISVSFLRARERDPNLLSLLAASRTYAAELAAGT
ncbi:LysR family transcriptional regulator [Pelomonas sp. KK5]|uniref:LysR family transcriptional regulator n=1 Tax=Pelomonas sp. KK5 TaxID=1855730 RepID=UPI00097C44AC|nr:LysR family transcriptional regulator [Pelomonas sp. KK5]